MRFDDENENLSDEQKQDLYAELMKKYQDASGTEDVQAAERSSGRQRMVANIGQALEGWARAESMARGGAGVNNGLYDSIRSGADKSVAEARQGRKDRIDSVLKEDELGWTAKERERKAVDWKQQDTERSRKDQAWKDEDEIRNRERDPKSSESAVAQTLAKKMMPSGNFDGMSAAQLKASLPHLEKLYQAEQQRLGRIDSINARNQASKDARDARQDAKTSEHEWKEEQVKKANDEKKRTVLNEIEDRRTNINAALDKLDSMIAEDGTWEALGSHNQDMDRLVDQVATDMAKLQDPNSVARPSEVEMVKRNLVSTGFQNSNSTARDIIANFRDEVKRRADGAYKIRGLAHELPGDGASNVAGGKSHGASGGWGEANAAPAASPSVRMVKIRNPKDGSIKQVPEDQVAKYVGKGGEVVK